MTDLLFFDFETLGRPESVEALPMPAAPATWKDPEKIAAEVARKRAEQVERAALDPDCAEILAVAFQHGLDGEIQVLVAGEDVPGEAALLGRFWQAVEAARGVLAGYNITGYDLPLVLRRSMALGVRPPLVPHLSKYQVGPVYDLMAVLYNWGPAKSLKTVARLYGIPNPLPDLDGSQAADMDPETLRAYVANDVAMAAALFRLMDGVYWPQLCPAWPPVATRRIAANLDWPGDTEERQALETALAPSGAPRSCRMEE